MRLPTVVYSEEILREGFGIAAPHVPTAQRLELLDALVDAGLRRITVGAFVSPRYVPQMADFEALLRGIRPRPGVEYLTFTHNRRAQLKALEFSPPLTVEEDVFTLFQDICDVHQRRNVNRSIAQSMDAWAPSIEDAKARGLTRARVAIASAWGSNFMGPFPQSYRLWSLAQQVDALEAAGLEVVEIGLHDSQSFCLPHLMEDDLREIRRRWPAVRHFHLHMHDARGMAMPSICAALRHMDERDTVLIDGTLGGAGGGQYCGNGMASGMVPTEDLLHMLEGMGVSTGVDMDKLIDCVWMLERMLGHPTFGHVSKAGPRPTTPARFYDPNLPAIESLEAARHFRLGESAHQGQGHSPWKAPIAGPWFAGPDQAAPQPAPDAPSTGDAIWTSASTTTRR
jgi:hydroxymethylglutaryl-CoA lyase